MKFTHAPGRAFWNAERYSLHWVATVDGEAVLFGVILAALEKLTCAEGLSREECYSAFELNRPAIERAAESVFARDRVRGNGFLPRPSRRSQTVSGDATADGRWRVGIDW